MIRTLALFALCWSLCTGLYAGQLERISAETVFDSLRLTLTLSAPAQYRYSLLENPDRLLVELTDTEAAASFAPAEAQVPPVSGLRFARKEKSLKLVFELNSSVLVKAYRLKAGQNQSERIVLELAGFKTAPVTSGKENGPPDGKDTNTSSSDIGASQKEKADLTPSNAGQKDSSQGKEFVANREGSSQRGPTAKKEPSAQKEPSTQKETSGQREPTVRKVSEQKDTSAGTEPAAQKASALGAKNSGKGKQAQTSEPNPSAQPSTLYSDPMKTTNTETKPGQESHAPIRGRKIIIALDAGHGGKDTGAVGARGVREKDVVLAIARELANQLNQDGRFKVALTRSGDQFIPLKGRRDKARKLKADVFVSIHADAFVNAQARGASVFALSQRGATSEMARFLAESENSSDLLGSVGGVSLEDKDEVLAGVLVDLSMTATLANSLDLGGRVLKELGRMADLHNHSVEQAGFVVLKSPDVPSILVETGFISNPEEAAQLNSPAYRQKIARAIFNGLNSYFATQGPEMAPVQQPQAADSRPNPAREPAEVARPMNVRPDTPKIDPRAESRRPASAPAATRPAQRAAVSPGPEPKTASATKPQKHKVVLGDSLEKIARKYGVSQKAIIQANGMPNATVKLGQTLIIPVP